MRLILLKPYWVVGDTHFSNHIQTKRCDINDRTLTENLKP